LRDEYKSIVSVEDINNLFNQQKWSYFSVGLGIGFNINFNEGE